MTFQTAWRGVAGRCADSGGPDCHRRPRVRCKRYKLEVLARVYRGAGRRPVLRPARNPARAFEFAGARRSMVRRHPWVLPGSAVRANSRRQVPGRVSRVSVKMIRGASGLEFLFINARAHSIGKALNIVSCDSAHGSFDVWSLIKKAGQRLAAVAFRGDHAISGVVPAR